MLPGSWLPGVAFTLMIELTCLTLFSLLPLIVLAYLLHITKVVTLPATLWRDCFSNAVSLGQPCLNDSSPAVSSGSITQPEGPYTEQL